MNLYETLGAPAGLAAVVPGFRSLQGLGIVSGDGSGVQTGPLINSQNADGSMRCVPPGFESIVAMTCPDGKLMPACGSGFCGDGAGFAWPSSVEELVQRITGGSSAPAPSNNSMRWGFFTVAAALLGVFVVYQELKK